MDHWGDPWADADDKSPTKPEATSPPPTITRTPVVLNGFLDDAQWGSHEDDSFGAWASSPRQPEPELETRVNGHAGKTTSAWDESTDIPWDGLGTGGKGDMLAESNEWGGAEQFVDESKDSDNVVSETSDSATTIQADDVSGRIATDCADSLHPDDDLSTRPSTSPSEQSHNEVPTESPRTSFEEERAAAKLSATQSEPARSTEYEGKEIRGTVPEPELPGTLEVDDDFGSFEENVTQEQTEIQLKAEESGASLPSPGWENVEHDATRERDSEPIPPSILSHQSGMHNVDSALLLPLFPPAKHVHELDEAPDDPVYSTTNRKTWYRLTRKQTMREFNSGNDDDNYIRVTWKTSQIRSDVNKIVARWATEDRRGAGARASFYWDTQAPPDQKNPFHPRKKSIISVSNPIRPAKQSVQTVTTDVPAAFSWSSPSTTAPTEPAADSVRSASSPVIVKHSAISKLQRQERPLSVDLTPRPQHPAAHKRTATATDLFSEATPTSTFSPLEPIKSPSGNSNDPWAGLGALNTNSLPKEESTAGDGADDDDWGDMVESPAISTVQTPTAEFSEPSTRNNTLSTPSTTPKSARSSPLHTLPGPMGSKHASPIVRLKGTVSPTSALFKPNAFVPAVVEDGPIGPGLLKSKNRSVASTPEKGKSQPGPIAPLDEVLQTNPTSARTRDSLESDTSDDDFSAFETSTPQPAEPPSPPPPSAPAPQQTAELDFSIFESSVPPSALPPSQPQADPADPWSIFETPPPPAATEPPTPFSRPPPQPVTPPSKQPLSGATNSAQRRKIEEDNVIKGIVDGLPDLSYMLQR